MDEISIQAMRKAKGLAQWQLAERVGVTQEAVAQWEKGKTSPLLNNLLKIADVLECTVDDLIRKEDG